jgi:hypothetical protein
VAVEDCRDSRSPPPPVDMGPARRHGITRAPRRVDRLEPHVARLHPRRLQQMGAARFAFIRLLQLADPRYYSPPHTVLCTVLDFGVMIRGPPPTVMRPPLLPNASAVSRKCRRSVVVLYFSCKLYSNLRTVTTVYYPINLAVTYLAVA